MDAALEDFDTAAGRQAAGGVHRRPVQLVRAAVPAPVLGRRPGRAGDPARVPRGADPAAGPVHAVRDRGGVAGRWSARSGRTCPTRCTCATGRGSTRTAVSTTRCWPSRSRWSAGWSSWAGRPATESKVRTRQPLGRALVGGAGSAGWAALPAELRAQVADELNVQSVEALGAAGGELVDVTVKPNFRALGKRFGSRHPGGRGRGRGRRPGRAGRRGPATAARPPSTVDGAPVDARAGRPGRHRDAAVGLGGGRGRRRDRRARPDRDAASCAGPGSPARWSGWCRTRARPAGWR